jgi:hypothetical protein
MDSSVVSMQLWHRIQERYDAAVVCGAASSIANKEFTVEDPTLGVRFILRIAETLKSKPKKPERTEYVGVNLLPVIDGLCPHPIVVIAVD